MRFSRVCAAFVLLLVAGSALTGCARTIAMTPGPAADDPACAQFTVDLGRSVTSLAGFDRVWTDAQSTAAWGTPAAVLVSCGAEPIAASTYPCQTVGGEDWVIDNTDPDAYLMTSFSTNPTVQVYLDLAALQEQATSGAGGEADPSAVVSRLTALMKDFAPSGVTCAERP